MSSVIIVGAGIAGAGIARDLTLRGIDVTVIEKDMPAASATGRCHGLLHSGARYAVNDATAAAECARENPLIKAIAPFAVEDTGGLFIATNDDEADHGDRLLNACKEAGVPAKDAPISASPNPHAYRCISVSDARIDPFLLTLSNLYDAYNNGAKVLTGKEAVKVARGTVTLSDGENLKADMVVVAAGYESPGLARIDTSPDKGTLLVTERRVSDIIVNRMRPPSSGDIIVPCHTTSIIGTTSSPSDSTIPTRDEYRALMKEASVLLPAVRDARIIRAFSGIRPLIGNAPGRGATRDFRLYEEDGLIAVAGGKLTTYRLIAQKASDAVMKALGERGDCKTVSMLPDVTREVEDAEDVVCYCERNTKRIIDMDFMKGADLSRFNRLGFGSCQGMRCALNSPDPKKFLEERWKGIRPVLDEGTLQQAYLTWAAYNSRMDF